MSEAVYTFVVSIVLYVVYHRTTLKLQSRIVWCNKRWSSISPQQGPATLEGNNPLTMSATSPSMSAT